MPKQLNDEAIDAGLSMLVARPHPTGGHWSHRDIAFVCGTTKTTIFNLEQSAFKKIRREFRRRGLSVPDLLTQRVHKHGGRS